MIQASLQYSSKPLDDLIGYLDSYADVADEEFNAAFDVVKPLMLDELEVEAPPVQHPIEWESEKQRRAFWASDGFGQGIPTKRTGTIRKAWLISKQGGGLAIIVKVLNPNPASVFLFGSLSKSNRGAHQQRFHVNTGWQVAGDTVDFWLFALTEQYVANMQARLGSVVGQTKTQRRSYTKPTRNK